MASSIENSITDEIIKRRLLIDGDGMGDERKLNTLIKSYLDFVDGNDTEENDADALKRMIAQAKQLDYVARRTQESIKVNEEAKDVYVDLQGQVKTEIRETKTQIVESKMLLDEATKHRKYSMEYDALAKLIESKPDRKITELKRMGLQLELDTLKRRKQRLEDQLTDRKRTVSQLAHNMEMVKDHLKNFDDKLMRRSTKIHSRNRNGEVPMNIDSSSQSEPPSPAEQPQPSQPSLPLPPVENIVNGAIEVNNGTALVPTLSNETPEKSKSEKYEDLSESDGDDHS